MADEPERRLVGVIHAELERQAQEDDLPTFVDHVATDGTCMIAGTFDLYLLARAVLAEGEK